MNSKFEELLVNFEQFLSRNSQENRAGITEDGLTFIKKMGRWVNDILMSLTHLPTIIVHIFHTKYAIIELGMIKKGHDCSARQNIFAIFSYSVYLIYVFPII